MTISTLLTILLSLGLIIAITNLWSWLFHRHEQPIVLSFFLVDLLQVFLVELLVGFHLVDLDPCAGLSETETARCIAELDSFFAPIFGAWTLMAFVLGCEARRLTRFVGPEDATAVLLIFYLLTRLLMGACDLWLGTDPLPLWRAVLLPAAGFALGVLAVLGFERAFARYLPQAPQP